VSHMTSGTWTNGSTANKQDDACERHAVTWIECNAIMMSADHPGHADETTRDLLARARAGDAAAREALCARYLPRLRRWARGRLPRGARPSLDTDDIVQETMLRTINRLEVFEPRGDGALGAYLRQSILNRIRDESRRLARNATFVDAVDAANVPDAGPSPLEEAIGRETLLRYEAALARLRDEERAAILARIELACPYSDVAEMLGKPSADAARMAVSRALVRLAREMAKNDERA
jgi:RNA polymerase sigma factor (sigma-70 family)